MKESLPCSFPMVSSTDLAKIQSSKEIYVPYRELIGSLQYLASSTRPDILFAVNTIAQYNGRPTSLIGLQPREWFDIL